MSRIESLTEILPYVRAFQGKTFVVKLGGEVCEEPYLGNIARQISLIHHIGIRTVVVHGGGKQMDALLGQLGIERRVVAGRRVTDERTLGAAKMLYRGQMNTDIVSALQRHGATAVGLSGVDAGLITVKRRAPREMKNDAGEMETIDFGFVGDVELVRPRLVELLLPEGLIPVVSSLGIDPDGQVYNVNADTIAGKIAQSIRAHKLILMTGVPGILSTPPDPSSLISYLDVEDIQGLIEKGVISGGMLPKVTMCIESVTNGVNRTHIVDGTRAESLLLEIFINEGCGTMIVSEGERLEYEKNEWGD